MRLTVVLIAILALFQFVHPSPLLEFIPPTPANNSAIEENFATINASIGEPDLDTLIFNWNGTDYSYYDEDLVLALSFENNSEIGESSDYAADISMYNNSGPVYLGAWVQGIRGKALSFDGAAYLNLGTDNSMKVESAPFTVELWLNIPPNTMNKAIISSAQSNYRGYLLAINHESQNDIDLMKTGVADQPVQYAPGFAPNTWYHIAAVQHFSNGSPSYVEYFVNGEPIGNFTDSSNYNPSIGYGQRIGTGYSGVNNFNGLLDEVRVYKRALSPEEVRQHYYSYMHKSNSTNYFFETTQQNLQSGQYACYLFANSSAGTSNRTETRTFSVQVPSISINSPENITYFDIYSLDLSYSVLSYFYGIDSCWYSLNGSTDVPLPGCENATIQLGQGSHSLMVYANNTQGGTGSASVSFETGTTNTSSCRNITASGVYALTNDLDYNEGTCIEINASSVILDLRGHSINCTGSCSYAVRVFAPSGITIKNGIISNGANGIYYNRTPGIYAEDLLIYNLTFSALNNPIEIDYARGLRILNNNFNNCGAMIRLTGVSDFSISGNYGDGLNNGISVYSRSGEISSQNSTAEIKNNRIGLSTGNGMEIAHYGKTYLENNTLRGGANGMILHGNGSEFYNYSVKGNNITAASQNGISLSQVSNSFFANNSVSGCLNGFYIDGNANSFFNNSACNNSNFGFYLFAAENNSGLGNRGTYSDFADLSPGFRSWACGSQKTTLILVLRNNFMQQLLLQEIALDEERIRFSPQLVFSPAETKAVSMEFQGAFCANPGDQVQFQNVILYYSRGGVERIAQKGDVPLVLKCS